MTAPNQVTGRTSGPSSPRATAPHQGGRRSIPGDVSPRGSGCRRPGPKGAPLGATAQAFGAPTPEPELPSRGQGPADHAHGLPGNPCATAKPAAARSSPHLRARLETRRRFDGPAPPPRAPIEHGGAESPGPRRARHDPGQHGPEPSHGPDQWTFIAPRRGPQPRGTAKHPRVTSRHGGRGAEGQGLKERRWARQPRHSVPRPPNPSFHPVLRDSPGIRHPDLRTRATSTKTRPRPTPSTTPPATPNSPSTHPQHRAE